VGLGNAKADVKPGKGKVKGKGKSQSMPSASPSRSAPEPSEAGCVTVKGENGNDEPVPVCPPVFEGDFWVNECLRVHRSVVTRTRGDDGQERDVNKRRAREMIKSLLTINGGNVFGKPVDPESLGIPDYLDVIKKPMDLGTVREKLRKDCYANMFELAEVSDLSIAQDASSFFFPL
jgi:hypothetical protein